MASSIPSTTQETILTQFITFPYLTCEQITRLLYSSGSARYVSAKLKSLTEAKFLHRLERETINVPYIYCLGIRGVRHLNSLGYNIPPLHPSEHTHHRSQFLNHTLNVNDFLIAASLLPSSTPEITVMDIRHDLTLKRSTQPVIPDGWIDFRIRDHTQVCIWLEMDMGTMDQKPLRKKVAALIDYSKEGYENAFGTPSLTIVFATPQGHHRAQTLRSWIQQELTSGKLEHHADLFRILCIKETPLCPETLFLSPISSRPFGSVRVPLLEE